MSFQSIIKSFSGVYYICLNELEINDIIIIIYQIYIALFSYIK
jgi:hypothetical protein